MCHGALHAPRPEDLWCGVSFPVGVVMSVQPKQYSLAYWCAVLLIFAPQVYVNVRHTPEEPLLYLLCDFYTKCPLVHVNGMQKVCESMCYTLKTRL